LAQELHWREAAPVIRLHVIAEGTTEEEFINELIAPVLRAKGVLAIPRPLEGNVSYTRLKKFILDHLKNEPRAYCTTFVDYYGLGPGFPERAGIRRFDPTEKKKRMLEDAIRRDVEQTLGNSYDHSHFIPYVQMHEFEGLLFSDPARLASGIYMPELAGSLQAIRALFATPEDIDEGKETAPSKRIKALYRGYDKPFGGNLAALEIGFEAIRASCPLFDGWVTRLELLGSSTAPSAPSSE
jgi:hypothetical protein